MAIDDISELSVHYSNWVLKLNSNKINISLQNKQKEEMIIVAMKRLPSLLLNDKYCCKCNDTRRS